MSMWPASNLKQKQRYESNRKYIVFDAVYCVHSSIRFLEIHSLMSVDALEQIWGKCPETNKFWTRTAKSWLVGGFNPPAEKYEFVSWDDDYSQTEWKVIKAMFQTTNQMKRILCRAQRPFDLVKSALSRKWILIAFADRWLPNWRKRSFKMFFSSNSRLNCSISV